MDQDGYLAAGRDFADGLVFMERAPAYGAWVGGFYLANGRDLGRTFFAEKYASVALLSAATGLLAWRLYGFPAGVLLGCWIANCRYLLLETNGSHALAASLYVSAALCLVMPRNSIRLPAALLLTYFSAQARSEMWIPLILILAALALRAVRHGIPRLDPRPWAVCLAICAMFGAAAALRAGSPEPERLTIAFRQNFAVGYVERHPLLRYPTPWESFDAIWSEVLPGAMTPLDAVRRYPGELARHFLHNLRIIPRAILSLFLRLDSWLALLIALPSWGLLAGVVRGNGLSDIPSAARRNLILWCGAIGMIVPISIVLRVAARYYIQLAPFTLVAFFGISVWAVSTARRWWCDCITAGGTISMGSPANHPTAN